MRRYITNLREWTSLIFWPEKTLSQFITLKNNYDYSKGNIWSKLIKRSDKLCFRFLGTVCISMVSVLCGEKTLLLYACISSLKITQSVLSWDWKINIWFLFLFISADQIISHWYLELLLGMRLSFREACRCILSGIFYF